MTAEDVIRECLVVYQRESPKPSHLCGPLEITLPKYKVDLLREHWEIDGEHCGHLNIGTDGVMRVMGVKVLEEA